MPATCWRSRAAFSRSAEDLQHDGPRLHLHRQRPRRLGGRAHQRAVARATRSWCWRAAGSPSAGARWRPPHGRRGRDPEGRHAPRRASGRGRGASKADTRAASIKAVLVAQIDTASGVVNDIAAIGQAIRAAGHDALLMVDCGGVARLHAVRDGRAGASTSRWRARRRA